MRRSSGQGRDTLSREETLGPISRAPPPNLPPTSQLLAISRMENAIIDELSSTDWGTADPWSETAQALRDRMTKLCSEMRMHLATQESLLPEVYHLDGTYIHMPPVSVVCICTRYVYVRPTPCVQVLREHWGRVSPPQLVARSLAAAKRAQAQGAKGRDKAKLLMCDADPTHSALPRRAPSPRCTADPVHRVWRRWLHVLPYMAGGWCTT